MPKERTVRLIIDTNTISIPDEFGDMRHFAGEFYDNMEKNGVELKEGLDFLPQKERAMNLFLCG